MALYYSLKFDYTTKNLIWKRELQQKSNEKTVARLNTPIFTATKDTTKPLILQTVFYYDFYKEKSFNLKRTCTKYT